MVAQLLTPPSAQGPMRSLRGIPHEKLFSPPYLSCPKALRCESAQEGIALFYNPPSGAFTGAAGTFQCHPQGATAGLLSPSLPFYPYGLVSPASLSCFTIPLASGKLALSGLVQPVLSSMPPDGPGATHCSVWALGIKHYNVSRPIIGHRPREAGRKLTVRTS
jgi:hypothetical protein